MLLDVLNSSNPKSMPVESMNFPLNTGMLSAGLLAIDNVDVSSVPRIVVCLPMPNTTIFPKTKMFSVRSLTALVTNFPYHFWLSPASNPSTRSSNVRRAPVIASAFTSADCETRRHCTLFVSTVRGASLTTQSCPSFISNDNAVPVLRKSRMRSLLLDASITS